MRFFFENENLCLDLDNGEIIKNITASVEYSGEHYDTILIKNGKWKTESKNGALLATDGRFFIEVFPQHGNALVRGQIYHERKSAGSELLFFQRSVFGY